MDHQIGEVTFSPNPSATPNQGIEPSPHEKRIRALEMQIHTLTQAVQHLMIVCEPLLKIAQEAHAQQSMIVRT